MEKSFPPPKINFELRKSTNYTQVAESKDVNSAINDCEDKRMPCRRKLHNKIDADWESYVMVKKIIRDAVVTLSQKKNEDFREKRKVINEIKPCQFYCCVAVRGRVDRLTAESFIWLSIHQSPIIFLCFTHRKLKFSRSFKLTAVMRNAELIVKWKKSKHHIGQRMLMTFPFLLIQMFSNFAVDSNDTQIATVGRGDDIRNQSRTRKSESFSIH